MENQMFLPENPNDNYQKERQMELEMVEAQFRYFIRRRNLYILIVFFLFSFGVLFYFLPPLSGKADTYTLANKLISFTLMLGGIGWGLFIYLQYSSVKQVTKSVISRLNESRETANSIPSTASTVYETDAGAEARSEPTSSERAVRETPLDPILERKVAIVQSDYRKIINRLVDEIERLGKTANYNLVFGSLATVAGVVILAYNAFDKTPLNDTPSILVHYIPRLSTIVFIEIFAFFFLKIYKANLADIKYFHNERTNIEQKILSLKAAIITGDKGYLKTVIDELAKTERNRVLKKGETTVELERERAEIMADKNVMDMLKSVLDLKGGKTKARGSA